MDVQRLRIHVYQLMDDVLFKQNRTDGTGWDWCWADYQRDWMNATPSRHAYRCLPLTIVNQTGWWIKNPVGFTANWRGSMLAGSIDFAFDHPDPNWPNMINSQFGEGIITWNTPFLFRTEPEGSRLLITGPANYFRKNAQPLTALIESDWMVMSFTMNYKILTPNEPVRFEAGEPLFQAIPLVSNICTDLEEAEVRYQRLQDVPEVYQAYHNWSTARNEFHQLKARNEVKPDGWQKDYFQGRDANGQPAATQHKTKLKPPPILLGPDNSPKLNSQPTMLISEDQDKMMAEPAHQRPRPRPRRQPDHWHKDTFADMIVDPPSNGDISPQLASCPVNRGQGLNLASVESSTLLESNGHPSGVERTPDHTASQEPQTMLNGSTMGVNLVSAAENNSSQSSRRVDDEWRRWIAENLMLETDTAIILREMVNNGFDRHESAREIETAINSPYIRGSELIRNRLKKRDWLLATYRKLNRFNPETETIPRRHKLSRGQFLHEYLSTNRPVIITGMMDDWPALQKWNMDFFAEQFADREVEVQFGRNSGANYEIEKHKFVKQLRFGDFVEMVRNAGTTNDFYLTAANASKNQTALPELWDDIVQIPEYFDGNNPHNGFLWFGPGGTITPFHHDLTNNFMAQVIGRKKVKIAPSWDVPVMQNTYHVFCDVDGRVMSPAPNPPLSEPQILECILEPGELLFLPIGCLHYVEGLEISVGFSFTNLVWNNIFANNYSTYYRV